MLVNIEINGSQSARVRWCKKNGLLEDACVLTLYRPLDCDQVDADSAWARSTDCEVTVEGHDAVNEEFREVKRSSWSNSFEFVLSCISMSVGLGNIFKFPGVAYKNGCGAFLVPYIVVVFVIGCPLYLFEMSIGQFSSSGPVQAWNMVPLFRGVGYSATLGTACVLSYYVSIMAVSGYYIYLSCSMVLPWSQCSTEWATNEVCIDGVFQANQTDSILSDLFYRNQAFPQLDSLDNGIGFPNLNLTFCLLISWVLVFLSLVTGVTNSGKIAWFTAIFPYGVLITLLINGATLPGGWDGIISFLSPNWQALLDLKVWHAAVGQCFFSLSTASGPVIMLASYNPFRHNLYRCALVVCILDTITSILAGLTTFAILGNLAAKQNVHLSEVVRGEVNFAFTYYPEAFSEMEFAPQLFSALYFLLLLTLGLGSSTAMTGLIITTVSDKFPHFKKWSITLLTCLIGFAIGLIYVTPGGPSVLQLVDSFGAGFVIYVAAIMEMIGVCWLYGINKFCGDIQFMLGSKIGIYWKFCCGIIIPLGLTLVIVDTVKMLAHDAQEFPASAIAAGWILATLSLMLIPILAIAEVYSMQANTLIEKFKESMRPTQDWGPKNGETKRAWIENQVGRMLPRAE